MPAFGAMLPDRTVWELVAYIQSISEKPGKDFGTTTSATPETPADRTGARRSDADRDTMAIHRADAAERREARRLTRRLQFLAELGDFFRANRACAIAPCVADIGRDIGNVLVAERGK